MMSKLLKNFFVCAVLMLVYTSCLNNDDKYYTYYVWDEPAVVESPSVIRTVYGSFYVPSMEKEALEEGSLLWTTFMVEKSPSSGNSATPADTLNWAVDFRYRTIDSTKVILPENPAEFETYLSDSYSDSIQLAKLYQTFLDRMLFFEFTHKESPANSTFTYEMVWEPATATDSNSHPNLYIRTKRLEDSSIGEDGNNKIIFGFDMTAFIDYYKEHISGSDPVTFNLKYKIGTDKEGKDVYRDFQSNPIKWNL